MKKVFGILAVALFVVAMFSSCGSRHGDKCPGVGQVQQTVEHNA
jgi:hypothetical protein